MRLVLDFKEPIYLKPPDAFSSLQVLRNCANMKLCNVMIICPFAPYRLPHGAKTCHIWYLWAQILGIHISETAGRIYSIRNYMELSRPVVVQR